jgi:hypothetical protein
MPSGVYERTPEIIEMMRITRLEHYERQFELHGQKQLTSTIEKRRQSLLEYYTTHTVWNYGIPRNEETRRKISEGCKRSGVGKFNVGRIHSDDWVQKVIESRKKNRKEGNDRRY